MKRKVKDLQPGDKKGDRVIESVEPDERFPGGYKVRFDSGKVQLALGDVEWEVARPRKK